MSDCNHDCENCKENCSSREIPKEKLNEYSKVKKVIAVVSGKGGVGKSMVTSLLATLIRRKGYNTAILDADITGPSIPKLFGITGKAYSSSKDKNLIIPLSSTTGIKTMSINYLLENDEQPVIWRGPVIAGAVKQFYKDVVWEDVDYMFVDMPPGTGDVPLTVFQSLPISGIVVVSSPQDLVSLIVGKAVNMAKLMNIPIIALVENMSYIECPNCKEKIRLFGESKVEKIAKEYEIGLTTELPLNPILTQFADGGKIELADVNYLDNIVKAIEKI